MKETKDLHLVSQDGKRKAWFIERFGAVTVVYKKCSGVRAEEVEQVYLSIHNPN